MYTYALILWAWLACSAPAAHLAAFSDHALCILLAGSFPSCIGDAEENETTQHYHTVAELSSTHLSDEPAKTDTDDNNATTIQDT